METKHLDIIANLGNYDTKSIIKRTSLVSIIAVIVYLLAIILTQTTMRQEEIRSWHSILFLIFSFIAISELNLLLANIFNKIPIIKGRVILQTTIFFIVTCWHIALWANVARHIFSTRDLLFAPQSQVTLLIGMFLLITMHVMVVMTNVSHELTESLKEIERLKNAKLQSDYSSLQDRLNPHFLFNNLSVLRSLIRYDAIAAEKFTENFTDVYRYVLHSHENKLVTLKSEIKFLNAYIALHKERLSDGFRVEVNINDEFMSKNIPPMSIQLLVENALKHNIASRNNPLTIEIYTIGNEGKASLIVKNKINKKETTYSTKTGLKTLESQITLISNSKRKLRINDDGEYYEVSLPLL